MYTRLNEIRTDFQRRIVYGGLDFSSLESFIEDIFWGWQSFEKKDDYAKKNGHYPYIPFNTEEFCHFMEFMANIFERKELYKIKFIDIGSGRGDKVCLASMYGFDSTGIEYTEVTHYFASTILGNIFRNIAINSKNNVQQFYELEEYKRGVKEKNPDKNYFEKPEITLIRADAFDLNLKYWDIIYTYVPINDNNIYKKLCLKIADEMKIGAYWFEAAQDARYYALKKNWGCLVKKIGEDSFEDIKY